MSATFSAMSITSVKTGHSYIMIGATRDHPNTSDMLDRRNRLLLSSN